MDPAPRTDYPAAVAELPFLTRFWFAWVCYFRVLFDGRFAALAHEASTRGALPASEQPSSEPHAPPAPKASPEPKAAPSGHAVSASKPSTDAALQLLGLLQREGRLIDFLEEDVAAFSDGDIGAAARVVHAGCRKALRDHVTLTPVRSEVEGAKVSLPEGFDPSDVKLTGNVQGKAPYEGTLRHRGWKVAEITLPTPLAGHDARVIAQAEVEL